MIDPVTHRTTDYKLNNTIFRVTYGDITHQVADVIVSSDDNFLSMGGGVSGAILKAGGEIIQVEARKHIPLNIGDVAVTSAGKINAKYIFHAITIDYTNMIYPSEESIQASTLKCMQLVDALKLRTIVFPALGTGTAGFPFQLAAEVMTRTIADYLIGETGIEFVAITLFPRKLFSWKMTKENDLNLFYERSVARASVYTSSKRLNIVMDELKRLVDQMNVPSLSEQIKELEIKLIYTQRTLLENKISLENSEQVSDNCGLEKVSEEIISISSEVQNTAVWTNKQLESIVLKTRMEGLLAQLNIQYANLNRLEIKKAKYGSDPPLYLDNTIDDIKKEITEAEDRIKEIRTQMVSLNQENFKW